MPIITSLSVTTDVYLSIHGEHNAAQDCMYTCIYHGGFLNKHTTAYCLLNPGISHTTVRHVTAIAMLKQTYFKHISPNCKTNTSLSDL